MIGFLLLNRRVLIQFFEKQFHSADRDPAILKVSTHPPTTQPMIVMHSS
jgi:hypothetical protein